MTALVFSVRDLPVSPIDAAAHFYSSIVPAIREDLPNVTEVIVFFEPADHSHRAWRLAAVQELAREAAPTRVNAIVGGDRDAAHEVSEFLKRAPGVTGQLLVVDGKPAENC